MNCERAYRPDAPESELSEQPGYITRSRLFKSIYDVTRLPIFHNPIPHSGRGIAGGMAGRACNCNNLA